MTTIQEINERLSGGDDILARNIEAQLRRPENLRIFAAMARARLLAQAIRNVTAPDERHWLLTLPPMAFEAKGAMASRLVRDIRTQFARLAKERA